jgi:Fur family iron response transcriptional regulator
MARALDAACREELRRAGLPGQGTLPRLLALLRAAPETHLGLAQVLRMAAEAGIGADGVARALDMLVAHGLLGRLPSTGDEPVFDTVAEPHSHLVYEETAQVVDLDVSPETLLAILRQALAERPGAVELMIRFRRDPAGVTGGLLPPPPAGAYSPGRPGRRPGG